MSGILNSVGSRSGLIGINIGEASKAKLASTFTGVSGVQYLTSWTLVHNDNTKLYSIATYGIQVHLTGTYMVNINCFTEGRSGSTHSYMYLSKDETGLYETPLNASSVYTLDDGGADGHSGRQHKMMSFPAALIGGSVYGIRSAQDAGTRNLPASILTSIGLTLLKIGT